MEQARSRKEKEKHTFTAHLQINHVPDADVDYAEKALVLLLELFLVEDLNCEDAIFVDSPLRIG